jgi:serine phosphatase RsbU (regulator of sigma subunit)
VLAINFLNDLTEKYAYKQASDLLELLREKVKYIFRESKQQDGMDIAFCVFEKDNSILQYAGANIPLFLVRNKELTEFKPVKNPIGFYWFENNFKTQSIEIKKNDIIYLSTDGYYDQFGSSKNNLKKIHKSRFKELLLKTSVYDFKEQEELLIEFLNSWKGETRQIDDILVMGIRLN